MNKQRQREEYQRYIANQERLKAEEEMIRYRMSKK
jgi:hypothetical protein